VPIWEENTVFVQVIQGAVSDAAQARASLDDWVARLAEGARGWLGSTAGVTDDGTFVAVARFDSVEAAQRNSGRAEQGEWWSGLSKLFSGEVRFHDCTEVATARGGGSDAAGFVQIMQGRSTNLARLREVDTMFEDRFPDLRPELLGYVVGVHDDGDGAFTLIAFFSSEEAARAGERQELPSEAAELLQEEMQLMQEVTYLDLREPWLYSPRT
jgi:hypothetical protein